MVLVNTPLLSSIAAPTPSEHTALSNQVGVWLRQTLDSVPECVSFSSIPIHLVWFYAFMVFRRFRNAMLRLLGSSDPLYLLIHNVKVSCPFSHTC